MRRRPWLGRLTDPHLVGVVGDPGAVRVHASLGMRPAVAANVRRYARRAGRPVGDDAPTRGSAA